MISNSNFAPYFVNSLNPHWVSLVLIPKSTVMIALKKNDTNCLWNFLYTFPLYYTLLEPTTIFRLYLSSPYNAFILSSTFAKSLNLVAPSASTISMYCPFATETPALTAPPFPLFWGYYTTTSSAFSFSAVLIAISVVLSLDPSFTIMISYLYLFYRKKVTVYSSMTGNLCS